MIYELTPDAYGIVRPLFEALGHNLLIKSILDRNTIGTVYVDDLRTPSRALLWNRMDALCLAGDTGDQAFNQAVGHLMTEHLVPDAKARYIPGFTLQISPHEWENLLQIILPGPAPEKIDRQAFAFRQINGDWRQRLPAGFRLQLLDETFLSRQGVDQMAPVLGWVHSFWPTIHDFGRRGLGCCLLHGDRIASWCLSVYAAGTNMEFGVETAVPYRQQGLATLAAAACVEQCLEQDILPHWHCNSDNLPSIRVAEKVGFEKALAYTAFRIDLV